MATTSAEATSDLGFVEQLKTLSWTYWVANAMEMFERLAYYGLRTVLPIYMLLAVEEGGPQFNNVQKGEIFAAWAAVQSFVPVFSGGLADRFGYKKTVAISIAIKVAGYLVMAFAVNLGAMTSAGISSTVPGHPAVYNWFMLGALLLAFGTAVFKPGLQGTLATQVDARNDSLAWAIFYQLVNMGGFLGPFLAAYMRLLAWKWVFVACAVTVCINYLLLLTYPEPELPASAKEGDGTGVMEAVRVIIRSTGGIMEPRLFGFLAVFSGFWAMFYQLFDLLPNFIDQWVDSSAIYQAVAVPITGLFGSAPPAEWGGNVPQEMLININAGLIMLFAFAVGYLTGKVRSMTAMIAGILVSAGGILALGTMDGWSVVAAIALFSLGEMMASPTKMRYFAALAPPGKKGLYLGYINATVGIGWSLGSLIAGELYEREGDKFSLARAYLADEGGMDAAAVAGLKLTEVMPALATLLGTTEDGARMVLWDTYAPQDVWWVFFWIGVISMVGLVAFDLVTRFAGAWEEPAIVVLTAVVTGACYGWGIGLVFGVAMAARRVLELALPRVRPDLQGRLEADPWIPGSLVVGGGLVLWILSMLVG